MTAVLERESLEALVERVGGRRYIELMASASRPRTRDEFIRRLYEVMDEAIQHLERRADELQGSSEDKLSSDVVGFLSARHYRATREGKERGHCDIVVQPGMLDVNYVWQCEAKIHSDYDYIAQGLRQVVTRYSAGTEGHAGLLVYVNNVSGARSVASEWRRRVEEQKLLDLLEVAEDGVEPPLNELRFRTVHKHNTSGLNLEVRHMCASLGFRPEDKSAKAAQKYRSA
jgi:hypothetical protein